MIKTLTILGTRPEAIKLAPVLAELSRREEFRSNLCSSGQHFEMLKKALGVFDISADYDLDLMEESQTLAGLTGRAITKITDTVKRDDPDFVIVQGDTTTAFVGALAAFYEKVPVGHVEAGLRSGDYQNPFPEEMNRRLADSLSNLYFAPTERSKENLVREGFTEEAISITGNTVVDALLRIEQALESGEVAPDYPIDLEKFAEDKKRMVLVTAHRRESLDGGIESISRGLKLLVDEFPDLEIVFPVHLNPKVQKSVREVLDGKARVHLVEPVDYLVFVGLMRQADLIITDSGGIQEEAPTLGVPVLVAREKTERPEAVEAGTAKLVGTDTKTIFTESKRLLVDGEAYENMAGRTNPFGRGDASKKIADRIVDYFSVS